jgi:uncharacterized protein YceH (UPF0502 family)
VDLQVLGPTIGLGALLVYTLQFLWREAGDRRRYEAHLRKEFQEERASLRAECAEERVEDRQRIAALESEVARLRVQLEERR